MLFEWSGVGGRGVMWKERESEFTIYEEVERGATTGRTLVCLLPAMEIFDSNDMELGCTPERNLEPYPFLTYAFALTGLALR